MAAQLKSFMLVFICLGLTLSQSLSYKYGQLEFNEPDLLFPVHPETDTLIMVAAEISETVELAIPVDLEQDGYSWYLNVLYSDPWDDYLNYRW